MNLFRKEAQSSNQPKLHGEIVVRSSWVFWALTAGVVLCLVAMLGLIFFGEYTRRVTVPGYLIPVEGVVRIYSPQAGRAAKVHVVEGEGVVAKQPLVTVVDERRDSSGSDLRAKSILQIQARQKNLDNVMQQQRQLFAQTAQGLQRRMATLKLEMDQLLVEQKTQATRVDYAKMTHKRNADLAKQNYVSESVVQEKLEAVAEQEAKLQTLQRSHTTLQREMETMRNELAELPMRERTQIAELERGIATAQQELLDMNTKQEVVVTSPQDGVISGLSVKPSQLVGTERSLMMLLPQKSSELWKKSELEAHLFAQSKDAGFVRPGQVVMIRYSAYPYQKFGQYKARVVEVSRTPFLAAELPFPVTSKTDTTISANTSNEPVFRIRATLDNQSARAYGAEQPLQSGMQLEADVMLDTRSVYEWIMEPIYSLSGKFVR